MQRGGLDLVRSYKVNFDSLDRTLKKGVGGFFPPLYVENLYMHRDFKHKT